MGWGWGWGWDGMEYNLAGWGWDGMLFWADGKIYGPDGMGWKDGTIFHSILPSHPEGWNDFSFHPEISLGKMRSKAFVYHQF